MAAIRGRSANWCKRDDGLSQPLVWCQVYPNVVVPPARLRLPLAEPVPTNGNGSAKLWHPRAPAMAAGLTDHVWTLGEGLRLRVPPGPQPQLA